MAVEQWSIPGADDQPIFGTTHLPDPESTSLGVLLICHGFRGYKDYGFIPQLAQRACEEGLIAHRFNFSHSGVTQNFDTFARSDLFELDTWGKQIEDIQSVAAACHTTLPGARGQPIPMVWFGHSRGGVTVILAASRPPTAPKGSSPTAVIAAAAPCRSCSLSQEQIKCMHQLGYLETPSARTGQMLRMGQRWLQELEQNPEAFDPLLAIKKIGCPILLIHGDADETVSVDDARNLEASAPNRAQLEIFHGASHVFNAPNPLPIGQPPPPATQQLIDQTITFAVNQCRQGA